MGYENVKLWFARDENGKIVTIDEVKEIHSTYNCPVCGSSLLPKATESTKVTPHFAHVDASKCNSESHVHWWFKNKFILPGDGFKIHSDSEKEYVCKTISVEQIHNTEFGDYRPDITVHTMCGKTIYFEMAFSNKKKIKDYLDMWIDLGNMVVQVDIKHLLSKGISPTFPTLYHNGKCMEVKRNDTYYHTVGKHKLTNMISYKSPLGKKQIQKLDWFWNDAIRYKEEKIDIEQIALLIDSMEDSEKDVVKKILRKSMCSKLYKDYKHYLNLDNKYKYTSAPDDSYFLMDWCREIDKKIQAINNEYKVDFKLKNEYKQVTYFNGSRSHPYLSKDVFSHYTAVIRVLYRGKSLFRYPVTNRFLEKYTQDSLYKTIEESILDHGRRIKCKECNKNFILKTSELRFFLERNLHTPKRCKDCRKKRKVSKGVLND